ncbi:MAG: 3-oxoacyl-ACP synthase III family protein [Nitrospiraceae bacterium]
MLRSRIVGTGSYVPDRIVTNAEVGRAFGLDAEAVYRRTGIRLRHWAGDGQATSDLAEHASRAACEAAGVAPSSVDAIVLSTTSPDMVFPSSACLLQHRLGASRAAAFDVAASCSGFLYALSMADRLVRSGQAHRCLVVAAEVKSRFLDAQDMATAMLFGDGAGAALLVGETDGGPCGRGVLGVRLYADGTRHGLIRMAAGGSRQPPTAQTVRDRQHVLAMQGGPLFRLAVTRLADAAAEILKEFGVTMEEVGQVVFHQANGRLLAMLRKRLGIPPEKMYSVIEQTGNTSSASLPIALDRAVREGRVAGQAPVLLGTVGGGLTWATALVRW